MQRKIFLFIILLQCIVVSSNSQVLKNFSLGIDIGRNYSTATLNNKWAVRQDVGTYYDSNSGNSMLNNNLNLGYFSLKPSFNIFDERFTVASGLRIQFVDSEMTKAGSGSRNFFYLRYNSSISRTDFARVTQISESNVYLGIPLEISYNVFQYGNFGAHLMLGAEAGYRVKSKAFIGFYDEGMTNQINEVMNGVDVSSNRLISSVYASVGANYNQNNKVIYKIDFLLPSKYLTKNNSSLLDFENFSGIQFSISFLLNKNNN